MDVFENRSESTAEKVGQLRDEDFTELWQLMMGKCM